MLAYTQKWDDVNLRGPTATEAEQADQLALKQLDDLLQQNISLDQALNELLVIRDIFSSLLPPRPRGLPQRSESRGKGKSPKGDHKGFDNGKGYDKHRTRRFNREEPYARKGEGKGDSSKGIRKGDSKTSNNSQTCHKFNAGACTLGRDCKYPHVCSSCGEKHARINCTKRSTARG